MNDDKMSFDINDLLNRYDCYECGAKMDIIDDVLVCPVCLHSIDIEDWVTEAEDDDFDYPTENDYFSKKRTI